MKNKMMLEKGEQEQLRDGRKVEGRVHCRHDFYWLRSSKAGGETGDRGVQIYDRKYCIVRATSLNDLRNKYELETDFVLTEKLNIVFGNPS